MVANTAKPKNHNFLSPDLVGEIKLIPLNTRGSLVVLYDNMGTVVNVYGYKGIP